MSGNSCTEVLEPTIPGLRDRHNNHQATAPIKLLKLCDQRSQIGWFKRKLRRHKENRAVPTRKIKYICVHRDTKQLIYDTFVFYSNKTFQKYDIEYCDINMK